MKINPNNYKKVPATWKERIGENGAKTDEHSIILMIDFAAAAHVDSGTENSVAERFCALLNKIAHHSTTMTLHARLPNIPPITTTNGTITTPLLPLHALNFIESASDSTNNKKYFICITKPLDVSFRRNHQGIMGQYANNNNIYIREHQPLNDYLRTSKIGFLLGKHSRMTNIKFLQVNLMAAIEDAASRNCPDDEIPEIQVQRTTIPINSDEMTEGIAIICATAMQKATEKLLKKSIGSGWHLLSGWYTPNSMKKGNDMQQAMYVMHWEHQAKLQAEADRIIIANIPEAYMTTVQHGRSLIERIYDFRVDNQYLVDSVEPRSSGTHNWFIVTRKAKLATLYDKIQELLAEFDGPLPGCLESPIILQATDNSSSDTNFTNIRDDASLQQNRYDSDWQQFVGVPRFIRLQEENSTRSSTTSTTPGTKTISSNTPRDSDHQSATTPSTTYTTESAAGIIAKMAAEQQQLRDEISQLKALIESSLTTRTTVEPPHPTNDSPPTQPDPTPAHPATPQRRNASPPWESPEAPTLSQSAASPMETEIQEPAARNQPSPIVNPYRRRNKRKKNTPGKSSNASRPNAQHGQGNNV